jgi:hypothetical protein
LELAATATTAAEPLVLRVRAVEPDGSARQVPWPQTADVRWLFVRVSGTQENRDAANLGNVDADDARRVMPAAAGTALVGVDLHTTLETWPPDYANAFARRCGNDVLCLQESISVRHSVSASTVVEITPSPHDAARPTSNHAAMSKSGQQAEIRPLMDPTKIQGGDLAVRVYVGGEGVAGAVVRAMHAATGAMQTIKADGKGIAVVNVDRGGEWRIEFHTLVPLGESWQATSSTLTFTATGSVRDAAASAAEVKP